MENVLVFVGIVLAVLAGLFVNFLPWLVAWARSHRSTPAIFLVCLFFGWSCVGWVVALVWSLDGNTD